MHTKGPWTFRDGIVSNDRAIAKIHYEHARYGEPSRSKIEKEDHANARLIAAAPDLLEAAKDALDCSEVDRGADKLCPGCIDKLITAIAKAEGK